MIKIFLYECKRLIFNKFFFGILFMLLFYGWQVLSSATILGVSHTAPFSAWSFGDYLSWMLPLLWIGVSFFLTFFTSAKACRTAVLTDATQTSPRRYALARCSAALSGTVLLALACLVEAAVFYGRYFGWYAWGELLVPVIVTLLPALVFALGSGWLLGRTRPWLIYVWMVVPFVCMVLPLPEALGLWNGSFFTEYPLTSETLDPVFSIPIPMIVQQCILLLSGISMIGYHTGGRKRTAILPNPQKRHFYRD